MAQVQRGRVFALVATLAACGPLGVGVDQDQTPGPSFVLPSSEPIDTSAPASTPTPTSMSTPLPATSTPLLSAIPSTKQLPSPNLQPDEPAPLRPSASHSGASPEKTCRDMIISGHVYDENGEVVDGAIVAIKSLENLAPYSASSTTLNGEWVVTCAPQGAAFEFIASKAGWTRRRQAWNVGHLGIAIPRFNFGGDGSDNPEYLGEWKFISDRPEVDRVEPENGSKDVDPTRLRVKLQISERLPDASRERLVEAIRVFPLSVEAPLPPEDDFSRVRLWSLDAMYPAAIRAGSIAASDPSIKATATWNAEGTEITLAQDQPLARGTTYAIALAAPEAGPILDKSGFPLGVGMEGTARATAVPGEILLGAFKDENLSITPQRQLSGGDARWQSTHLNATTFTTAP